MSKHELQVDAILRVLTKASGDWVRLPAIIQAQGPGTFIGQYNARIWELRGMGHVIENKTANIYGVRHSWYRLVRDSQKEMSL